MKAMKTLGICALAFAAVMTIVGCQGTTKSGTQYTTLPNRSLQAILPADINTVHANSLKVLRDEFGYAIESDAKDALEGMIKARTARQEAVTVTTFKEGDNATKIRVNTGMMSGDWKAREILSRIETVSLAAAKTPTPTATTTAAPTGSRSPQPNK